MVSPLSRYEFRLVRVTAPPRPPPSLQGELTLTVCLLFYYLLSLVVLHRAVAGNYAKRGVAREKKMYMCVHCRLSRILYLPYLARGASWSWERA